MSNLLQTPRPTGGFRAMMADPPWAFERFDGDDALPQRRELAHYATKRLGWLARLPVRSMAAADSALFLWIVDSHLPQALDLGAAWGFEYKTIAFVWDKGERIGMGYYTRKQAELCLLFTRGTPKVLSRGVRQIIRAPRREHSRKPDEAYARAQKLVGGPYLEMFARTERPGWTCWGDQTDLFKAA